MRILIVYTNRNRMLSPAPIGALLVTERLSRDGHEVRLCDLMFAKDPRAALVNAIAGHRPDLVGFSIRNVDNQMMTDLDHPLEEVRRLAEVVRRRCRATLLLGGTAVTTFPERILRLVGADYAFAGDDVDIVASFVASLERGEPDLGTPGLYNGAAGALPPNPPRISGYAQSRFTGFERINLRQYRRKGFYDVGLVTHSGCPLRCSFCDSHRTFGSEYVLRDPRVVVEELKELRRRHGAKSVWLINCGLNRPPEYGKELCARIAEATLGLSLGAILEPGEFDAEMARRMRAAGVTAPMLFGTTLADPVLERNQPFYRRADVETAARLCREAGMDFFLGQMYGAPGETLATIRESLEIAHRLKPAMIVTEYGFRIQPETPLRQVAVQEGVIAPEDDGFEARFYLPPEAPAEGVAQVLRSFRRRHPFQSLRMVSYIVRSMLRPAGRA
jgi:radical SAM superfamily enzyme YgiQ (UPF0313 family)